MEVEEEVVVVVVISHDMYRLVMVTYNIHVCTHTYSTAEYSGALDRCTCRCRVHRAGIVPRSPLRLHRTENSIVCVED